MSPSLGGALVSCVKRAVPEREMNWHRQDYTQQVNKGCDTRSLICLLPAAPFWYWQPAAVAQSISGSLRRPALQYACTHHNWKRTPTTYKPIPTSGRRGNALSCCVPAFTHIRRGGSWLFPNNKDSGNLDDSGLIG